MPNKIFLFKFGKDLHIRQTFKLDLAQFNFECTKETN